MGRRLGELLVAEGRISNEILARALELQTSQARGLRLGAILLRWGLIPETVLLDALAAHHHCPAVQWVTLSTASQDALGLLSAAQVKRLSAVPYAVDRKTVHVAFSNPSNLAALDEVQAITGRRVVASVTTEVRLLQAQQRFYQRPLAREVMTILQKIERPTPVAAAIASAPAVAPPEPEPSSLWIEGETKTEESEGSAVEPQPVEAAAADPVAEEIDEQDGAVEDLLEPAPALEAESLEAESLEEPEELAVTTEPMDPAEQTIPVLAPRTADFEGFDSFLEGLRLGELVAERPDPFADDTPLADFIEQALAFYEAHPSFRSALAALDDGTVEELDELLEERASRLPLDSTVPSSRPRQTDPSGELTL
jgi:type II secretion system (T2SS) protein E